MFRTVNNLIEIVTGIGAVPTTITVFRCNDNNYRCWQSAYSINICTSHLVFLFWIFYARLSNNNNIDYNEMGRTPK